MCHVIVHKTSRVAKHCFESLLLHNWTFTKFDAINGTELTDKHWKRLGVSMSATAGKLPLRPGAQGCFFSHFRLWEECANTGKPIVILEHDAVVQGSWPNNLDIDQCIIKLYRSADCKLKAEYGTWSKGSHAYTLTPDQAIQLINRAKNFGASPVDKHIISKQIPWKFLEYDLVTKNPRRGRSTTSGII